jgi:eukaryotic-like serine/threonine-protein kinase
MSNSNDVWKALENRVIDGQFPLRQWLGGSDHSAVFLTERTTDGTGKAVIKLIPAQGFSSRDHSEENQLSRWAVTTRLSHPQLIRLFEFGRCQIEEARFLYVVMEYAEENLGQIVPQRPLSPNEVSEMLPPLTEALSFLHAQGIVHSRIKPSNILAVDNQLKISSDSLHNVGEHGEKISGAYDAPEVVTGLTPAADVWSLGVLLITVLTQNEPAELKRESGQVVVSDAVPEPYRRIAQRCLRVDPRQRGTIDEILRKPQPHEPASAFVEKEKVKKVEQEAPQDAKNRWIRPALVLATVVIVVALLAGRIKNNHPAASPAEIPAPQTQSAPPSESQPQSPASATRTGTTRGSVLHQVLPEVSRQAQNTLHGHLKVVVEVTVDASGNVAKEMLVSAGPSHYFSGKALAAAHGWKFTPPQVDGQPSPSTWTLRFQFGRGSTQVFPAQIKP